MASLTSQFFSWVFFGTKLLGGILGTLMVVLYANQDKLLYIPNPPGFPKSPKENPPGFSSPGEWSVNGRMMGSRSASSEKIPYEEHFVNTDDGKNIHVWLMLQRDSEYAPTLIYFHGNAGNMGFRLKNAAEMYSKAKVNVLMMDYRGYGSSDGSPSEKGLNLDADAVLKFAVNHPKLKHSRMIAFGRSLGGAVSVSLAHRHPQLVSGIVLENTFTSISGMVDVLMPFVSALKGLVLCIKWDSDVKIAQILQPILFISGDADQLVPPHHMKRLFELAAKSVSKVFYSVSGGTHNDTWEVAAEEYHRKLRAFLEDNSLFTAGSSTASSTKDAAESEHSLPRVKSPSGRGGGDGSCSSDEDNVEDPDYLMVSKQQNSIPTMDSAFQVK